MLLYELFERGPEPFNSSDLTTFNPKMGSQHISVDQYITPEERETIDFNVPRLVLNFPVMYVYIEPMTGNDDRQDALKMRKQDRFKTPEHETSIESLVAKSVQTALRYESAPSNQRVRQAPTAGETNIGYTGMAVRGLQNKQAIIVPLPSSSKLSLMIASQVAQVSGGQIVPVLQKSRPNWSSKGAVEYNKTRDPNSRITHEDPRGNLDQMKVELATKEEQYINLEPRTQTQRVQAQALEKQIQQLESKIKNFGSSTHSQKSMYSNTASNRGALYYGHFTANSNAKSLNGKDIILIDDNVYSGQTFAEAVKSLLAVGVKPKSVVGFVLHKFS